MPGAVAISNICRRPRCRRNYAEWSGQGFGRDDVPFSSRCDLAGFSRDVQIFWDGQQPGLERIEVR